MTVQRFAESVVEDAALAWLEALGIGRENRGSDNGWRTSAFSTRRTWR